MKIRILTVLALLLINGCASMNNTQSGTLTGGALGAGAGAAIGGIIGGATHGGRQRRRHGSGR